MNYPSALWSGITGGFKFIRGYPQGLKPALVAAGTEAHMESQETDRKAQIKIPVLQNALRTVTSVSSRGKTNSYLNSSH